MKNLSQYLIEAEDRYTNVWPYDDEKLQAGFEKALPFAKIIKIVHRKGLGGSVTTWVTICLQEENDIPNHIWENAAMWRFIYEGDKKWSLDRSPRMYLSPFDKSGNNTKFPRLQYLAMRDSENLRTECGMKLWRKTVLKTDADVVKKISDYVKDSFELVEKYTGGYPYHNGVLDISIEEASKK